MAQVVGFLLAVFAGFLTWGITLAFANSNPIGKAGGMEALIFFAPVISVVPVLAVKAMNESNVALAAWIVALAPIAGALNIVLFVGFHGSFGDSAYGAWLPATISVGIWVVLAIFLWVTVRVDDEPKAD